MKKEEIKSRRDLEEKIIERARQDEDFKKLLLSDPHSAIAQMDVQVPRDIEIKVLEESARVAYLVLPANQEELKDEDLDMIAAGGDFGDCLCNSSVVSCYIVV